jgi:hemin uptake protein HemP
MSSKTLTVPAAFGAKHTSATSSGGDNASAPRVSSQSLFNGAPVLEVDHNGQIYRLQKTALGKLILTK